MTVTTQEAAPRSRINWKAGWRNFYQAGLSVLIALLIGALLLLLNGRNPLEAFVSLWEGAFGSVDRFAETLVKATPLLMIAISVSISFRCQILEYRR